MFATIHALTVIVGVSFPAPKDPPPDNKAKGFFGVRLIDNNGVVVSAVDAGSPADRGGILPNDTILSIQDERVPDIATCREVIGRYRPGAIVRVDIRRNEKAVMLKVRVGARPEGP